MTTEWTRHAIGPFAGFISAWNFGAWALRACLSGIAVTLLAMGFNLVPIVDVPRPWIFGFKVGITGLGINIAGAVVYWRGTRRRIMAATAG